MHIESPSLPLHELLKLSLLLHRHQKTEDGEWELLLQSNARELPNHNHHNY